MPKKADTHIQNRAPGPPTAMAPVTPIMLPGPTRMAELRKNAASGDMPVSTERFSVKILMAFLKCVTCINPSLKLKKMPDPKSRIMANEKLPRMGMFAYHAKLVGKSHKKSDRGPINPKTLLIPSNTASILYPPKLSALQNPCSVCREIYFCPTINLLLRNYSADLPIYCTGGK